MNPYIVRVVRTIASALVAGIIASCGGLLTVLQSNEPLTERVYITAGILGVLAIANSIQSSMSHPPEKVQYTDGQ